MEWKGILRLSCQIAPSQDFGGVDGVLGGVKSGVDLVGDDAFRERLRDLGYVEGRNIILEFRFAGGDRTQGRRLAEELVTAPVDVIVEEAFTADVAAATERIPIVSVVLSALALSLAI